MGKREKDMGETASMLASQLSLVSSDTGETDKALLKTEKTFRIAVTGDVFVTQLERKVIDTPDFQRLRGVRQLGSVFHVYPTALHTRFDHSLGTLAMAERMIQAIENNTASDDFERDITPIQKVLARLYALLHDVTHVPFGHTIEDELHLLQRHDENPGRILKFLGPNSPIGSTIQEAIGQEGYGRFMRIYLWEDDPKKYAERLTKKGWEALTPWMTRDGQGDDVFIHDLVSNTICADLLDYVMRDSHFCNLGVGLEYRFINFLYLSKPQGSEYRRTFVRLWKGRHHSPRRDTMTDLARLLEARYMIAERAYFHHTKIISGAMLGRALQEQILAGALKEQDLYTHTDDTLVHSLCASQSEVASKLAWAVRDRVLHKVIGLPYRRPAFDSISLDDVEHGAKENVIAILVDANSRRAIENELAEKIGGEHGDVLIYAPTLDMNPKAADMNVRWSGKDMKFREIADPIVRPRLEQIIESHHMLWGIHLLATKDIASDAERSDLLKDAFETEFLCAHRDREKRKRDHFIDLIEFKLKKDNSEITNMKYSEFRKKLTRAADALVTVARDGGDFKKRIKEVIERYVLS